MGIAATTFVSQNVGAKRTDRAERGSIDAAITSALVCGFIQILSWIFAP
jgi:Na+-driven multidrug efflux pump